MVKRAEPDYLALDEAKSAGIEPHLPDWLPAGYVFESLDIIPKGRRNWVHYRFSDGLNVLSLFQCPPRSRLDFGGRQKPRVKLAHGRGYRTQAPEGNVLSWNSGGWRFVLVGPAGRGDLEAHGGVREMNDSLATTYTPPPQPRVLLRDLHPVERPREKLARSGPEALSDQELLALVLRTGYSGRGVMDLAAALLEEFPGGLPAAGFAALRRVKGVGRARAAALVAAFELARRF